jgi:putative aminopeptidase FrvX
MANLDRLLQELTQATGIGYGGSVRDVVAAQLRSYGMQAHIQDDGSVIGHAHGNGTAGVMIACHLDEVGFMVSRIDEAGRISFSQVGGVDGRILPGQEVVVHGKRDLRGYIGAKPPHLMSPDERKQIIPPDQLFIDCGLSAGDINKQVTIGDYVTFNTTYHRLKDDYRSAKSLDNRASVACGLLAMKELAATEHILDVYIAATSQEEFSGLGARIHSYRLPITYAVVIDVTFGQHHGSSETEYYALDKGPTIGRGATIPEKIYNMFIRAAKELEIPYQIEALVADTGTDAESIAFNKEGIPTGLVSIPVRYLHTPVEVVCLKDIERATRLVVQFIKVLDAECT